MSDRTHGAGPGGLPGAVPVVAEAAPVVAEAAPGVAEAARRVVVIGDLEPTRLLCTLLTQEGADPVHLLDPGEADLRTVLGDAPADAVAIVVRGDLLALRFALLVEHLQPGVPVVATIFDRTLGRHLAEVLPRCTITSPADVAAPAIAAACLEDGPLAVVADGAGARALVDGEAGVRLVDWAPRRPGAWGRMTQWWPHRYGGSEGLLLAGLGGLLATLAVEWALAATVLHEGLLQGLYTSARLVATVGPAAADAHGAPGWYLVVSALLMLVGIAFTGALVAGLVEWIVGSRTAALVGPRRVPTRGHVVVSGLGQVGLRVAQLLRDLRVPVVVVERSSDAPNLPVARFERLPVVVGDASSRSVLDRVRVQEARAVAALGSEDLDNVAVVINALAVAPAVRAVLRAGEGTAVTETTSLFRIARVSDVAVLTAAWVCASVRGERPLVAWSGAHRVGVLTEAGERRREAPGRCSCSGRRAAPGGSPNEPGASATGSERRTTMTDTALERPVTTMPRIGDPAPEFTAASTQGQVSFPRDYAGRWVILFSHPADFTPVCTTEFMTFATMQEEFRAYNTELVGLSVDGLYSHIAWLRTIKDRIEFRGMKDVEVTFPLIDDVSMEVATRYGMIMPGEDSTKAVRAVFVVDPRGIVRAIIYYPLSLGRNFDELLRVVKGLQTADAFEVATPADWRPGDRVIVPPAGSCGTARDRMEGAEEGVECEDWFFCTKDIPEDVVESAIRTGA